MPEAPLSHRQRRAMALAGTVALPTPFPEVGRLTLVEADDALLAVEHEQSNRVAVIRTVRLADVAALALGRPGQACNDWRVGPDEVAAALADGTATGIAYVRESAQVLLQVEVGMTAAESAEYYPPVVGERTDSHYAFGKGGPIPDPHCCCGGCNYLEVGPAKFGAGGGCNGCNIFRQAKK